MKLIRFHRLSAEPEIRDQKVRVGTIHGLFEYTIQVKVYAWEIAYNEKHLWAKLDGEMAEIIMPAKHWMVRLWRRFLPLRGIDCNASEAISSEIQE